MQDEGRVWQDGKRMVNDEEIKKLADEFRKEKLIEDPNNELTKKLLKMSPDYVPSDIKEVLTDSNLFENITNEFSKKVVNEKETTQIIFLCAAGGRLVTNSQIASFNLLVNDDAGAGKDYVCGSVLEILPKEVYIHKTRISPTVFTYWHTSESEPDWTWDGKVFYPEDISETVLNSDVFKVMCSGGSSATITIKNKAVDIEIKGKPVMITTTATATPSPELTRRFAILNLDSSQNQTKAIMKRHSEFKMKGIVPAYDPIYKKALGYLRRVKVVIPFCDLIPVHFPSKSIIMRTNYPRFLDYIAAAAALHQLQREKDEKGFVLANGIDYNIARKCFLRLCSNRYMIPLTINQKKILEVFEKKPELRKPASHLQTKHMTFVTLPTLLKALNILVSYGILEKEIEKDAWNRDMDVFSLSKSYSPNEKVQIPTYKEICRKSLTPKVPLTSKILKTSLTPKTFNRGTKGIKGVKGVRCLNNSTKVRFQVPQNLQLSNGKTISVQVDDVVEVPESDAKEYIKHDLAVEVQNGKS
jgi:hypothetical protein